jgi:hypothetical protein
VASVPSAGKVPRSDAHLRGCPLGRSNTSAFGLGFQLYIT